MSPLKRHKREICPNCLRPIKQCYCHTIKPLECLWPIHIIQHAREAKHPLGTARIASLSLNNCHLHQENIGTEKFTDVNCEAPLLVYPGDGAIDVGDVDKSLIRPLVFVDATWRKSRRMLCENPQLNALERISFNPEETSRYRIRKSPANQAVSTLEAIVFVLSVLESSPEKYLPLLQTMDFLIDTQIAHMGEDVYRKNYGDNSSDKP